MRGTGFGIEAERQPRLFRQGSLRWPERIHAYPVILGTEAPLPLPDEARIDHLAYRDLHQFMDRVNRYTDHEARVLLRAAFGLEQHLAVDEVELDLLATGGEIASDEGHNAVDVLAAVEQIGIEFHIQRGGSGQEPVR